MEKIKNILLYLILFLLPFNLQHILNWDKICQLGGFRGNVSWSIFTFDILLILLFLVWLYDKLRKRKVRFNYKKLLKNPLSYFILVILLATIFSIDWKISTYGAIRLLEGIILFLVASDLLQNKALFKMSVLVIFFSGVLQATLALIQFVAQKSVGLGFLGESVIAPHILGVAKFELAGEKMIRAYGTFPHPNLLAAFLLLALAAGLWVFIYWNSSAGEAGKKWPENRKSILISAGLVMVLFGIFLSYSRSVIALAVVLILTVGITHGKAITKCCVDLFRKMKVPFFLRGAVSIFIVFYFLFLVYNILVPRLCLDNCYNDNSINLRQVYLGYSGQTIVKRPILGVGPGNYVTYIREAAKNKLPTYDMQPVHNLYFLIAAELGLVGLIFFLLFLFTLMYAYMRVKGFKKLAESPLGFVVFLFLLLGLIDHYFWTLPQGIVLFWLSLAFLKRSQ